MTSTTERPVSPSLLRIDARSGGAVLCLIGFALLAVPKLLAAAFGLELLAMAFWCWARSAPDREEQIPRWAWLRRPAAALWLAAAMHELIPGPEQQLALVSTLRALDWIRAAAVLWAGLELLAALPLVRHYSDRPGPLLTIGPWLPVLLPSAGFVVLWRHAAIWTTVDNVRRFALILLAVTLVLAALRAFSRRRWVASLRWLMVAECALAGMLVGLGAVRSEVSLMLWLGVAGGRAALLAGELRGAAPRRRAFIYGLWRLASWTATAALAWPVLLALGFGRGDAVQRVLGVLTAAAVVLLAWVTVARLTEAPERRAMVRRESALPLTQFTALLTLAIGPVALIAAWWWGFEAAWPGSVVAALPALAGGAIAFARRARAPAASESGTAGGAARGAAHGAFQLVVALERRLAGTLAWLGRAMLAPTRDLHTGDAQEYLLFLVGVSVLSLVLPLLR
jgi:hypothetical protein